MIRFLADGVVLSKEALVGFSGDPGGGPGGIFWLDGRVGLSGGPGGFFWQLKNELPVFFTRFAVFFSLDLPLFFTRFAVFFTCELPLFFRRFAVFCHHCFTSSFTSEIHRCS